MGYRVVYKQHISFPLFKIFYPTSPKKGLMVAHIIKNTILKAKNSK